VTQAPRARVLWTECGLVTPAVSEAAKRVVRLSCVRSVVDDESDVQAQLERLAAAQRAKVTTSERTLYRPTRGRPLSPDERDIARRHGW
jgi:hypothetical protein